MSDSSSNFGVRQPGRYLPVYDDELWWWYWFNAHYWPEDKEEPMEVDEPKKPKLPKLSLEVDLRLKENKFLHRTKNYGVPNLVVRRGEDFTIVIKVNRQFDKDKDRLNFIFRTGPRPQASKGTLVKVIASTTKLNLSNRDPEWLGYIDSVTNTVESGSVSDTEIVVKVKPPADCPVGKYKVEVNYFREVDGQEQKFMKKLTRNVTKTEGEGAEAMETTTQEDDVIYVLFNAWCKDDQVYMESEEERQEYVLNETGVIFVGSSYWPSARNWNFSQMSKYCLDAAMQALAKSDLDARAHGNATKVCRALSSMVNKCGFMDKGILVGNWSGDYSGFISPTAWTGSKAILEQYMKEGTAVRYGQCWVFSGVTTTLGRALGIPTRSVTNFDSAHDKDESMTIDKHFDSETGKPIGKLDDSVWNFHVWNESWFTRQDLPNGFDGWQAFDATPQELSEGEMQCGPASVKAIKEGEIHMNHDAKFIFAEVNGAEVEWDVHPNGDMTLRNVIEFSDVGSRTLTKGLGEIIPATPTMERIVPTRDVTHDYKYYKATPKAKEVRERAYRYSNSDKIAHLLKAFKFVESDVAFDFTGKTAPNGDVAVKITAVNNSNEVRSVCLGLTALATYYTGIASDEFAEDKKEFVLQPAQSSSTPWGISAKDYLNVLDEDAILKVYLSATVKETNQTFRKSKPFELDKPDLRMTVSNAKPVVGEEIIVQMAFDNPLELDLTLGEFTLEGPGIVNLKRIKMGRTSPAKSTVEMSVTVTPKYGGKRDIIGVYNSRQLVNICGSVQVDVLEEAADPPAADLPPATS